MSTHDNLPDRVTAAARARRLARGMARQMAVEDGSAVVTRPLQAGSRTEVSDVEPLAGFRAAHDLELGASHIAHSYLRTARETGATWHDIGMAMAVNLRKDAEYAGYSPAELAYRYAVQPSDPDDFSYDLDFRWNCETCHGLVRDDGPYGSPAASERGHSNDCARYATAQADWQADREATD
jgi:hypothetical protein